MENQLHQQSDSNNQDVISPQQEKISLLSKNSDFFKSILYFSLKCTIARIILFVIVLLFADTFLASQNGQSYPGSWSIIFFVIAFMTDCVSILNDVITLHSFKKDQHTLENVKVGLANNADNIPNTQLGSYTAYLSIYTILSNYRYRSVNTNSISDTVRYLSLIFTFCIFGNMALQTQGRGWATPFQSIFLWLFMLSIYINVFQADLIIYETSDGPYLEKSQVKLTENQERQKDQSLVDQSVKDRYIKGCRRPFETLYIVNILLMLAFLIYFWEAGVLSWMIILCISAHVVELVYEKYLQEKLVSFDLSQLPYKQLNGHKILSGLTRDSKRVNALVRSWTRITIALSCFGFFRRSDTPVTQFLAFSSLNLLLYFAQKVKFYKISTVKLYVIQKCSEAKFMGKQCSICLLSCDKSQKVVQLPCFQEHIFHEKCMDNWLSLRRECPLCRSSLEAYVLR